MGVARDLVLEFVESMQKAKSPTTTRRILPKKWRKLKNNSPNSAKYVPQWKPEGNCSWSCKNGRQVNLTPASLTTLTDVERLALQKVALNKAKALDLGCSIHIPKDWNVSKRSKKSTFSSLRKRTASTGALDSKGKDSKEPGWVFGIPLGKCIANDQELRRRKPAQLQERRESLDITHNSRTGRKSSNSSGGAVSLESPTDGHRETSNSDLGDELPEKEGSKLLDALSLSSSANLKKHGCEDDPLAPHIPQIPYVVTTCCKHLETYGLQVLGIFRIGSSKKRARQLREELDSGHDVKLNEHHNAHDVAALLKEYFRDLPDPLLTRDLYSAFVATRKIRKEEARINALQLLVSLLPVANRDTLWALLRFLNTVVQHSCDKMNESGQLLAGNKMDANNLATLFGPNLLHKAKGGEFQVESMERAEERRDVIGVIKDLIDKQSTIFLLKPSIQDDVYRFLLDMNPEALDQILKKRAYLSNRMETEVEITSSSYCDDSESSSVPHSPGYGSETDPTHPRTFAEAMNMGATPQVLSSPNSYGRGVHSSKSEGHSLSTSASHTPLSPHRHHRTATRVASDDTQVESRGRGDVTLKVPASYRLSAPDQMGWYRGDRSMSPASPRISPSPKAMKAGTPEMRVRIARSDLSEQNLSPSSAATSGSSPQTHVRRSLGVPHGPGPGGHRSKSHHNRNTLTVPTTCSRSKSSESCSSVSSGSTGYHGGSSRSGTNSPRSPDRNSKWYLEDSDDNPSPLQRTSSTHRPLGFNVQSSQPTSGGASFSSNSSSSTLKTSSSGSPAAAALPDASMSSPLLHTIKRSSTQPESGHHQHGSGRPPAEAMDWQKEHWKHWESLTKRQAEDFHEQETLV